jgi:hypothetical protein
MALNTIYQVIHKQLFGTTIKTENVYFFNHISGTGDATALASDFVTTAVALVNAMQSSAVHNQAVDVINLGDTADFESLPVIGSGANVAEPMPAFNAISFTVKPDDRALRHGGKRIVGLPEASAVINEITSAPILDAMEAYRIFLMNDFVGEFDTWKPILVKRVRTPVAGTVPLKYTYRLPETDDELVTAGILLALSNVFVQHQTSRTT